MAPRHASSSAHLTKPFEERSATQRSRLSRRVDSLLEGDARLPLPRLFRDICREVATDLGGADGLSVIQRTLIQRYAAMCILGTRIDSDIVQGKPVDVKEAALVASTQARLASRLGIKRQARDVTPDLRTYTANNYPQLSAYADDDDDDAPRRGKRSRTIGHNDEDD